MLTILGKRSSINVRKVLWTCEEAGLEYQQEDYGSGFKPLDTPEFQRLNPNSLVPVLLDDRVHLVAAAGADGAHVGQSDMPVAQARAILGPDPILGLSVGVFLFNELGKFLINRVGRG